jgi:rod shape determining protein RodA
MIKTESQNVIKTFNTGLIVSMFVIFSMGLVTLYSATKGPGIQGLFRSQLICFVVGLVLCSAIVFIDSQVLEKAAYPLYAICLLLLGAVLIIGHVGNGSQRWLKLGPIGIQPSEVAKIAIVFTLAKYFRDEKEGPPYTLRRLIIPGLLVAPYFLLILLQPDVGTAGILFLSAASMVLFLKVYWKSMMIVIVLAVVTIPVCYKFVLRDYQRDRVKTFLDPGRDPRGSGYNALQCKIAVGSGKIFGKGFLKGTQSQLNFIPEQHTDFIFSVFAEERGFMGALALLIMYYIYCIFALRTVSRARDKFEMLLAFGCTSIMFWHVFINIGMVSGVLPIVGVTLPFFSWGRSSLLTFMITTAILLNLGRKRYIF